MAFDSINNVYLVLSGEGQVLARFVSGSGQLVGTMFSVNQLPGCIHPRALFVPELSAFLVTWHSLVNANSTVLKGRLIRYTGAASP